MISEKFEGGELLELRISTLAIKPSKGVICKSAQAENFPRNYSHWCSSVIVKSENFGAGDHWAGKEVDLSCPDPDPNTFGNYFVYVHRAVLY